LNAELFNRRPGQKSYIGSGINEERNISHDCAGLNVVQDYLCYRCRRTVVGSS
jgi:hypothetical protein